MTSDLNSEDVKNKLFHSLKSRGVLDSLKSQLRKQLIRELQDTTGLPVLHSTVEASSSEKESDGIPLFQRAANSIVAEYLKRCNFEYTLSTFLPESGTTLEKRFSCKDILHLLNIDPNSKLYLNLERSLSSTTDSKGFLWHFLMEVAAFQSRMKCDVNIQTEDTLPTQISASLDKLSSVEKEYREKQKLVQLDKNHGLEERLIAMQKKYEVEKKNELEEEVKKFRASELSRLRMDERQKYEAKIKAMRHEYDEEFNIKNQALRALEKEMLERVERLQEVHQSEAYVERQRFLEEMRSLKERETDFKNRTLIQER
ncbi:oral-facial-digital syndrome 1 isoform X2 [Paramuricea clavata]|uniref:Oral-facial-digital syndrome 1 isoform X2 n=1 Tax=Paramuricea clavata TaxID=317549 RepID=A0A6S7HJ09_PARCT|nr:oral-facial-digital syndrome 1 isoform X2 [Paramuricea clavata]